MPPMPGAKLDIPAAPLQVRSRDKEKVSNTPSTPSTPSTPPEPSPSIPNLMLTMPLAGRRLGQTSDVDSVPNGCRGNR